MSSPRYELVRPVAVTVVPPLLDAAQQHVVDHPGGPLTVLAGPGTGKTTTLVEAVADRIQNRGVPVDQILVLTFGQRAAGELRDRITARLSTTIREPLARTFHSYAFAVLRMAADADVPPPRLLSGTEQDMVVRDLIGGAIEADRSPWPASLRPALATHGFATELRDLLLRASERGISPSALARLGAEYERPYWTAAAEFMQEYTGVTALARPGAYDAAELIQAAIATLYNDPELLARERTRRRHIFVDEVQDTDPSQLALLELLAAGAEELVLVGDPDQSIYAFRGADPAAMRHAAERFGGPTVELITSRRAGSALLGATRRVASRLPAPAAHRRLVAAPGVEKGSYRVSVLRSATEEAATIATRLRRAHLDDGIAWSQMAVIVRSTTESLAVLRRAMITAGVPVASAAPDVPLSEQNAVSQLLTALGAVVSPESLTDETMERLLLGAIGGADGLYLRRLRRELLRLAQAAGNDAGGDVIAPILADSATLAVLPARLRRPLSRVDRVIAAGRTALAESGTAEDVLWAIWSASGLAVRWERQSAAGGTAGAAADRDLDSVIDLFGAAARLADRLPGATAAALLEHVVAQQVPGDVWTGGGLPSDGVQILTAHAAKGLEWDVVCVAAVQEGRWPDLRRRGSVLGSEFLVDVVSGQAEVAGQSLQPVMDEERRLFYVAVTRARRHLMVTAVSGEDEQPSRFLDELDPLDPSSGTGDRAVELPPPGLHLADLTAQLRAAITDPAESGPTRAEAALLLARLADSGVPGADPDEWWGIGDLSDERGLIDDDQLARVSPSKIESYDRCALTTVLNDVGAREESTAKAAMGSAVHEIAELADAADDLAQLETMMDERWSALDFGAPWYGRTQRKRATRMLERLAAWLDKTRTELALVGKEVRFSAELGDALLHGSVDRLERDADGRLVIVDFKTGGSPVNKDDLAAHPQLGAYQLAVALGAFADPGPGDDPARIPPAAANEPGGARLVQLGITRQDPEQVQSALDPDDDEWIRTMVARVAGLQRGHEFSATVNSYCQMCSVRRVCPAVGMRQVTE